MRTLDPEIAAPDGARTSAAAARNAPAILEVLRAHMPARGRVLEIAAGSGQHATAFSSALSGLTWMPSDPSPQARASIAAWRMQARASALEDPAAVDVLDDTTWPDGAFQAVVCINMIHISPWAATEGLMRLAGGRLVRPGGLLVLYGPFREPEVALAPSNAAFDADLKMRDPAWGLREREAVVEAALAHGLRLTLRKAMPANNLILLFRAL